MMKRFALCLLAGGLSLSGVNAVAQEVVHVTTGTVRHVNPQNGMIIVKTDDGSGGMFKGAQGKVDNSMDKALVAEAVPADKFTATGATATGDQVIVFYFGDDVVRTAVAVDDLGKGPFETSTGTVTKFDHSEHLLTIKDSSGAEATFHIVANTVADTTTGAVEGFKYGAKKGDKVRITAAPGSGGETALLIVPAA